MEYAAMDSVQDAPDVLANSWRNLTDTYTVTNRYLA